MRPEARITGVLQVKAMSSVACGSDNKLTKSALELAWLTMSAMSLGTNVQLIEVIYTMTPSHTV